MRQETAGNLISDCQSMQSDIKVKIMKLNDIRHLLKGRLPVIAGSIILLSGISGCSTDYYQEGTTNSNGLLKLEVKGASSVLAFNVDPMQDIRMFTSYRGGMHDGKFSYEIYNIDRQTTTLTSQIKTGDWNLTLLSPQGTTIIHNPVAGQPMSGQLMYEYKPVTDAQGKSTPASEFLFGKTALPTVGVDQTATVNNVSMARNVAKIEVFVEKANNIDLGGTQTIELTGVPSKIDWEGRLMPSKDNPDTLKFPLKGKLQFQALSGGGFGSDTLAFVIPAHRGTDFLNADGTLNPNPTDTLTQKMRLKVTILNAQGETVLAKAQQLPAVAKCNQILRLKLKLNSLDFSLQYDFTALPDWGGTVTSGNTELN